MSMEVTDMSKKVCKLGEKERSKSFLLSRERMGWAFKAKMLIDLHCEFMDEDKRIAC